MQANTVTAKPYLPPIKFLLNSPEMYDQQISVELQNHPSSYINSSSRKLPTLSLNIPSKAHLVSPVERNIDNMTGYHKGNHYPRLPSISAIGQIESVLNKTVLNNNRDISSTVQKPNSIQSLLSPPESPDMTNNPSFNDYETHHNYVATEQQQQQQQQQQRPRMGEFHYSKATSPVYSSNVASLVTPHYHQSYVAQSYAHPEQRGYDRAGGYHQEHVTYDRTYAEQHRAYPSSNNSPTTLQPAFSPYESRSTTVPSTLPLPSPMMNGGITRRYSTPITTKIMNDQLTPPITGGSSSNNHNNRYQCPYCSKRFSRPSSLRIHTYSHTGEKPFVCTEPGCGRKFSVQSNMRRHLRVHRLGRPVKKVRYDGEVEGVKMLNHGVMRNC